MILTRQSVSGGRPLKTFPFNMDSQTELLGLKLGYCGRCNEPILIRTIDASEFASKFGESLGKYYEMVYHLTQKELKQKVPLGVKIAKWLLKPHNQYLQNMVVQEIRSD